MVLNFVKKWLDTNQKELNRYTKLVEQINALEPEMEKFEDSDFAVKTMEFKERLSKDESMDDLLVEAFALAREAAKRTSGLRAYDVQMMAAMAIHEGRIAEQKTGEGKTLTAVPVLYLNALAGKGVHLVTVNDYLARRDAGWNGPALHLLGLTTAVIIQDPQMRGFLYDPEFYDEQHDDVRLRNLKPVTRKEAYAADITYGTNTEFGFDYLRDNMANSKERQNQREHHFAIVDEVDSILIDEARTPLIISAPDTEPTSKYMEFARLANRLQQDVDYTVDEKLKSVALTEDGIARVEKMLGVSNLYEKDFDTIHHIENALRARSLYLQDRHYVIRDDQVVIVDEFTGRLMPGRRWSEGLHQAVEAKEGVKIQQESRTLATVSLQNYFRMYEKLAGMTATAATEAEEFRKIYNLEVVVIPTNKPVARQDNSDLVYKNTKAKYNAIVEQVAELYQTGQPVLIGTTSIEKNELVSTLLQRRRIPHKVLNAKNHEGEAAIIAEAGVPKGVTVATNIAGRGVDIVLGGAKPDEPKEETKKAKEAYEKELMKWKERHDEVLELGGLYVIGTERHESRRIDNQLRGRSGRQGDPGGSRFYVALDDEIMRLFGGDQIAGLMDRFNLPEDQPLEAGMVSRAIEQAQVKVEGFHFDQRKHLVEYDDVMNKQREIIYELRKKSLEDHDFGKDLREKALRQIDLLINVYAPDGYIPEEVNKLTQEVAEIVPMSSDDMHALREDISGQEDAAALQEMLHTKIEKAFDAKEKDLTPKIMREVERATYRMTIDQLWMEHLDAIDDLREGIGLRGYAQKDPLVEYKQEAFASFENLMNQIDYQVVRRVMRAQVQVRTQAPAVNMQQVQTVHRSADLATEVQEAEIVEEVKAPSPPPSSAKRSSGNNNLDAFAAAMGSVKASSGNVSRTSSTVTPAAVSKKIGRNDPCWCGSGKKFKKCHYPEVG